MKIIITEGGQRIMAGHVTSYLATPDFDREGRWAVCAKWGQGSRVTLVTVETQAEAECVVRHLDGFITDNDDSRPQVFNAGWGTWRTK